MMLELQGAFRAICFADDHHEGCCAEHFEVSRKFGGVPDFSVDAFERLPAAGVGVDLRNQGTARGFCRVGHLHSAVEGLVLGGGFWFVRHRLAPDERAAGSTLDFGIGTDDGAIAAAFEGVVENVAGFREIVREQAARPLADLAALRMRF